MNLIQDTIYNNKVDTCITEALIYILPYYDDQNNIMIYVYKYYDHYYLIIFNNYNN